MTDKQKRALANIADLAFEAESMARQVKNYVLPVMDPQSSFQGPIAKGVAVTLARLEAAISKFKNPE